MNPRDFLEVADELSGGSREAEWRSACSRAYYAAFHVARELLRQCGFEVPQAEQAHAYLWLRLQNCGQRDLIQAGRAIQELRGHRNWADYDLDDPFLEEAARDSVNDVLDAVRLLDDTAALPEVLAQVTAAIRVYERDVLRQETWRG